VHDGQAYCEKDYLRKFGQKCMGCGEYITTGEFVNALDGDWHRDCFVCTVSGLSGCVLNLSLTSDSNN
jgi:hypothetical protein